MTGFAEFANAKTTQNTADSEDGPQVLLGAMCSGRYECNYTAVYHLMTHEDHMLPEDLFQYTLVMNALP